MFQQKGIPPSDGRRMGNSACGLDCGFTRGEPEAFEVKAQITCGMTGREAMKVGVCDVEGGCGVDDDVAGEDGHETNLVLCPQGHLKSS